MSRFLRVLAAIASLASPALFGQMVSPPTTRAADELAWRTLVEISKPPPIAQNGGTDTGAAWRLWWTSFDIYRDPTTPPQTTTAAGVVRRLTCAPESERLLLHAAGPQPTDQCEIIFLNAASVKYVLDHRLWIREELISKAAAGQISFPGSTGDLAVEMKTEWRRVTHSRSGTYVTATDKNGVERGLVAFHLMIHALPNWVWATYIHEDYVDLVAKARATLDDTFGSVKENARKTGTVSSVPPNEPASLFADSRHASAPVALQNNPSPQLLALLANNSVGFLSHYKLIGTQIDFDKPRLLGNPLIEPVAAMRKHTISCISCHSYAAINATGHIPTAMMQPGLSQLPPSFSQANFNFSLVEQANCMMIGNHCSNQ